MKYSYAIIGSGKQGTASAYDLIKFGDAEKILLIDNNLEAAEKSAELLNTLTGTNICTPLKIDVSDSEKLKKELTGINSIISGVPYYFNLELSKIAIEVGANFFDFGGNTDVVKSQLDLNEKALDKNISIVPDCGMDPGMNISFIQYLVETYDELKSVKSYGAGLMQYPKDPWKYELSFHINGLTNEYYGNALFLRDGKVAEVPCFSGYEILDFPEPLGKLEAAVTSGGLSTLPYELADKVETLENKTLRYLGHWEKFKAFSELGLFEETPINISGKEIVPRDVYHSLLAPKIATGDKRDLGIIKIFAEGIKNGNPSKTVIELIDYFDDETGFTAMQRLTGWHASIMAILSANNQIKKGAVSVNNAISGKKIIDEIKKRGIKINIEEN
ncbi:MAG: saccharopine dehydrogenase NADP-binding domain-containing protein [Ignavibacteriales bacterium]|nr:saccharopine dehydrogenase NADP-binding domain-containing protein [Ignavibacteriales bacterium]